MYYIGIDIGTTSICGVRYNSEACNGCSEENSDEVSLKTITLPNDSTISGNNYDERLQDPQRIYEIVVGILDNLLQDGKEVMGIGVTGQMHGMLYTDATGNAVSPLVTWQDGRGNRKINDTETYAEAMTRITGYPVATGFGLLTHYYNSLNNLVPHGASRISTIMDYVVMKLTNGSVPVIDSSNAASLGVFDKTELRFDAEALGKLNIDTRLLPVVASGKTAVGYYKNIPVFPAIGDNQAAFIGSVADREEAVHVTVGTSSQISVYSPQYIELPELDTRPLPGGGYIIVGAELCGGYSLTLLKNFFSEVLKHISGDTPTDDEIYACMATMPRGGEAPLTVDTRFDGTRQDPAKRGGISGISSTNFLPGNLVEGFLSGISIALYDYYKLLPASIRENKKMIVASGNGLRKNLRLREVFEETFSLPMTLSDCREEAAYGAARYASLMES